ncbi:HDIG domain-containing protein [Clostridium acidisoli DSM 12555]|uniref:HDIG domain-containing protein n=1 Tax=Clostridium acidisoli DSM 12555 TaxID=1121291 RepID=A0A1W1XCQ3_9CLOT|nr:HD domain-containing protein [Clostridium acidisoli]SMC21428.1 HDIG domain-containing protein [Clostridium acidisoli DSM 12555]
MEKIDLIYFYDWFDKYVKTFLDKDTFINENIKLKEEHTKRVCDNANMISRDIKINEHDKNIAEIAALFHDIGRFEQFKKYKTFNDKISENHALLGIKVLKQEKVLSNLKEEDQKCIFKAIENHNLFKLEKDLDEKSSLFSKIIRDADKLDIYKVVTDYYKEPEDKKNTAIEHDLPNTKGYSSEFMVDIMNGKNSSNKYIKNRNDMRLIKLTWIFDINYNISLKQIINKKYIEKTFEVLPRTEEMDKMKEILFKYINEKIN